MFQASLEMFRSARSRTIALVDQLSQEQLDFTSATGKWSTGEVLDHLLLAEKVNRDQIVELIELKKSQQTPFVRRSFADVNVSVAYIPKSVLPVLEIPFTMLNTFVPTSAREFITRHRLIPAQTPDIATPRKGRLAAELREELADSFKKTETLFKDNPDLDYCEMQVQHPLMGTNNVPELLRFMALHEQRHQSQINNTLASPRFPKPQPNGKGAAHVKL
jgi:uncharacterized damage-inducible protein DinB